MSYIIQYDQDYKRTIPACIIENRANIPEIRNQIGVVIKAYADAAVAQVTENVIPYKIITDLGALVGYFLIQISNMGQNGVKIAQVLRPQFQSFMEISEIIDNFILTNSFLDDILL